MTVHVPVRSIDQVERGEIDVEPTIETFTPQPFAASSGAA
jgi:hypothetical protein